MRGRFGGSPISELDRGQGSEGMEEWAAKLPSGGCIGPKWMAIIIQNSLLGEATRFGALYYQKLHKGNVE